MKTRKQIKQTRVDISQVRLRAKINSYLRQENRPQELIEKFTKGHGYCHGLATLAAYAQFLESLPDNHSSLEPKDDWNWLVTTLKMLSTWDEDLNSLSHGEKADIERLVAQINYFQNVSSYLHVGQGSLHCYLEDTTNRQLKLEYSIAGLFTANDFTRKLKIEKNTETLINILTQYPQRLILISCGNHTTSLFRSGDRISLYNANNKSGRRWFSCESTLLLVKDIFKAYKFEPTQPSPLGFRIFTFDDVLKAYPLQKLVLSHFDHPLALTDQSKEIDYSALHIATRIGSKPCVEYYLDKGAELDGISTRMRTPLHIAASRNYLLTGQVFISRNADINKTCGNKKSPLIRASAAGHLEMVKLMLDHTPNASFNNLLTAFIHLATPQSRNTLIKILDTKTLADMMKNQSQAELQLMRYKYSKQYDEKIYIQLIFLLHTYENSVKLELMNDNLRFFAANKTKDISKRYKRIRDETIDEPNQNKYNRY